MRLAAVDKTGRFILRAAPGENFPYFVNTRGVRMAWDTRKQPPVVVKEGETTTYNMLITPEVSPEEKLKAARKLVEALSKKPSDRTAQILLEFRKLNHTVDETELWCLLMRELVAVGREAVPQLCAELDRTTENRMLRRLGFALRAIGDPRAVPALIRAIPKTLLPSSSDYGLIVSDKELTDFMQTHDLDKGKGGTYFDLGRPGREIVGALHGLTGQNFDDAELFSMSLSEDPRRQVLQRRIYGRQAQRWQAWWEANWRTFTDDAAYQKVNLNVADEPLPPARSGSGEDGPTQRRMERGSSLSGDPERPARLAFLRSRYRLSTELAGPHSQGRGLPRCEATGGLGVPKRRRFDVHHPSFAGRNRDVRVAGAGDEGPGDQRAGLAKPRQADRRRHASRRSARRRAADALRRQIAATRAGCECRLPLRHPRRKHGT